MFNSVLFKVLLSWLCKVLFNLAIHFEAITSPLIKSRNQSSSIVALFVDSFRFIVAAESLFVYSYSGKSQSVTIAKAYSLLEALNKFLEETHLFMFSKFPNFVLNAGKIATKLLGFLYSPEVDINENFEIHTVIARPRNVRQCVFFQFEVNKLFWLNVIVYTARPHPFGVFHCRCYFQVLSPVISCTAKPAGTPATRAIFIQTLYPKCLEKFVHRN